MDDGKPGWVIVFTVVVFLVGALICGVAVSNSWKAEAVKRGYAEYSNTSGEWQRIEKGGK
jgi:hypothetical protein